MIEHIEIDESLQSSELLALTDEQQHRLTVVLDQYLSGLERGEVLDVSELQQQHPDLADVLSLYLEKLDVLMNVPHPADVLPGPTAGNAVGQRLGDFRLLAEIGRGGMGIVYEAHQTSLNRPVAIKLLPLASMLDAHQIARFHNEAHAAGLLQHAHIVPVYSVGVERGLHFYAMQLIEGISLDVWINQQRQLRQNSGQLAVGVPWQTVVSWAAEIADALQAAHAAGVIHRDIKPSNLMLDRSGKIWVTDFGLARVQSDVSLTGSGDLLGTMRYMSPEQASGNSTLVDGRCDIYSLAATVYELLTLRPVHQGAEAATLLKEIEAHQIVPLRRLCPELPRDLETVVHKALSQSRDERYETALALSHDLRRVLAGEPTVARPPSVVDRLLGWTTRHRRQATLALLVVGLGFVGLAIAATLLAAEKRVSDVNAIRSHRNAQLARNAVDELGPQIAELLSDIPAAENVRRRLLTQTLDYYQRFAAIAGNDPEISADLALTYGKIGALNAELGAHEESLLALSKCEQLYARLASRNLTDSSTQLAWSTSQNNLAEALHRSGQLQEAAQYFAGAMQLQEKLLAQAEHRRDPTVSAGLPVADQSVIDTKLQLATTLNNLGLLLTESKATDRAVELFRKAISLLSKPPTASTEDSAADRPHRVADGIQSASDSSSDLVARVRGNLSAALLASNPQQAVEEARAALAIQTSHLEIDPSNARLAVTTIATLNTLGSAQTASGQHAAAIESFQRSIAMAEQLLQRLPQYPAYRRDLVLSLNHLGLACTRSSQLDEARQIFERAQTVQQALADEFPLDAELQSVLGGVHNNLGFLHQKLGNLSTAAECFRCAVSSQQRAVELAPEVPRYHEYLKKHLANLEPLINQPDSI